MAHALATHFGQRYLYTAFFADDAAMLEALVLSAQTFVVLHGTENLGAEQAVALRLERPVVDGLGFFHFPVRPGTDFFGRCQADLDGIELFFLRDLLEQIEQSFHSRLLSSGDVLLPDQ